jgi:O-6-methylguanine DNA methyltransferase
LHFIMRLLKTEINVDGFPPILIIWQSCQGRISVLSLRISPPASMRKIAAGSFPAIGRLAADVREYLQGARIIFSTELLCMGFSTDFQRRVLMAAHSIAYGTTISYGEIARLIGRPHAARAVGNALGANPFPILIPCHRVIQSDGGLGGYTGGQDLKRRLLAIERVHTRLP